MCAQCTAAQRQSDNGKVQIATQNITGFECFVQMLFNLHLVQKMEQNYEHCKVCRQRQTGFQQTRLPEQENKIHKESTSVNIAVQPMLDGELSLTDQKKKRILEDMMMTVVLCSGPRSP